MQKPHIIFVDDDPHILSGLQRMLHRQRQYWDMEFANGGRDALHKMHHRPADIVISDMRMPEMDGTQLLELVRKDFPQTIRGILSGQAEKQQTLQVIGKSHFYISKPCHPGLLRTTIERISRVIDVLPDSEVRQRILELESVPSHPQILESISEELAKPEVELNQVSELIASDMGLSAKLLQLVCTSFFGRARFDCSPKDAVSVLGTTLLSELFQSDNFAIPFPNSSLAFSLDRFFQQSRWIADVAAGIAERETDSDEIRSASYNSGWLRGIGQLVLSSIYPQQYQQVLAQLAHRDISLAQAERECFDCDHADVGGFLLGIWSLPDQVVDAVRGCLNSTHTGESFSATTALQAAMIFVAEQQKTRDEWTPILDPVSIQQIKSTLVDRLPVWRDLAIPLMENG
jgi:HD-like signal output (HDOD) protein